MKLGKTYTPHTDEPWRLPSSHDHHGASLPAPRTIIQPVTQQFYVVKTRVSNFVEQHSNSAFVKSHSTRCVLGRKDTKDGPVCVITPEESGWYHAYVNNFLLDKADLFAQITFLLTLP